MSSHSEAYTISLCSQSHYHPFFFLFFSFFFSFFFSREKNEIFYRRKKGHGGTIWKRKADDHLCSPTKAWWAIKSSRNSNKFRNQNKHNEDSKRNHDYSMSFSNLRSGEDWARWALIALMVRGAPSKGDQSSRMIIQLASRVRLRREVRERERPKNGGGDH